MHRQIHEDEPVIHRTVIPMNVNNTHIPTNTQFLTKQLKLYNGKKKASLTNGACIIGWWPVENSR